MDNINYIYWIGPIIAVIAIAVVLLRVVLPIFRLKSQTNTLLATGIPAEATVLNAAQTGSKLTIGGQEQYGVALTLEVRAPGRAPYATQTQAFISILQLSQSQPGAVIPVKIDPQDQTKIAVDLNAGLSAAAFAPIGAPYGAAQQQAMQMVQQLDARNRDLSVRGELAQAKILRAQPSGININGGNPLMNLEVEVYPTTRPPFQAQTQAAVGAQALEKFQPGKMVWIKFDPNDTTQVTIEHSA